MHVDDYVPEAALGSFWSKLRTTLVKPVKFATNLPIKAVSSVNKAIGIKPTSFFGKLSLKPLQIGQKVAMKTSNLATKIAIKPVEVGTKFAVKTTKMVAKPIMKIMTPTKPSSVAPAAPVVPMAQAYQAPSQYFGPADPSFTPSGAPAGSLTAKLESLPKWALPAAVAGGVVLLTMNKKGSTTTRRTRR